MNCRQRVKAALNHSQPDMVPISAGSTSNDCFTRVALKKYSQFINLGEYDETVTWKAMQTVATPEVFLSKFQSDFRTLRPKVGKRDTQPVEYPDRSYLDDFGVLMKPSEYYYDPVDRPLCGKISIADIERFKFPEVWEKESLNGLKEEALRLHHETDFAIVADFMVLGPFEGGLWIRGWEDFLCDFYDEPILAEALMERITDYCIEKWGLFLDEAGDFLDIICQGDDLAMQDRSIISPEIYKKYIKKHHQRLYSFIKSKTQAKILHHSCGSVYELLPDLIDCGVEILNPVQTSAKNMDPLQLKQEFGNALSFWGGLDVQKLLPFGSLKEIKEGVKKIIDVLGNGGGYVFAPSHNIQPTVPVENIHAMFTAALEYR